MTSESESEAWRWGDLFELDVPAAATVRDLGDMIELRYDDAPEAPLFVAVFSPLPADEPAVRAVPLALARFAASRGFTRKVSPEIAVGDDGVVAGRLAFMSADLAWLALACGWNQHLVLMFAAAPEQDAALFDRAEALSSSLRPSEVVVARALAPEAPGDF